MLFQLLQFSVTFFQTQRGVHIFIVQLTIFLVLIRIAFVIV